MTTTPTPTPAHVALVADFAQALHNYTAANRSGSTVLIALATDVVNEARNALNLALAQPAIAAPDPALEQPKLHAMQHALRQIVDADDAHELTQQIIDIGRAALALPTLAASPGPLKPNYSELQNLAVGSIVHVADTLAYARRCVHANQVMQPVETSPDADIFWHNDDSERRHYSIHNFITEGEFEAGTIVTIQCATRLPNIKVRVIADPESEGEVIFQKIDDSPTVEIAAPVSPTSPHPEFDRGFSEGWDRATASAALSAAPPQVLSDACKSDADISAIRHTLTTCGNFGAAIAALDRIAADLVQPRPGPVAVAVPCDYATLDGRLNGVNVTLVLLGKNKEIAPSEIPLYASAAPVAQSVNAELLAVYEDAIQDIESWESYASEYFQKKWSLPAVLKRHRARLAAMKGMK